MLLGNYNVYHKLPLRFFGGRTVSDTQGNFGKSSAARNCMWGENNNGYATNSGVPHAYRPPYTWVIPQRAGAIGSNTLIVGTGQTSRVNLAGGLYGMSTLSGSGQITNAYDTLLAYFSASLSGSTEFLSDIVAKGYAGSTLTGSSNIASILNALGNVVSATTGSCDFSSTIFGTYAASATLSGSADIIAGLNAIGSIVSSLSGAASVTDATLIAAILGVAGLVGGATLAANLAAVLEVSSDLSGTSTFASNLAGAIDATATLAGSGSIDNAVANMLAAIVGTLSGSCASFFDCIGAWPMVVALSGSSQMSGSSSAPAHMSTELLGLCSVAAGVRALGKMSAELTPFTELSPQNLAAAVWNALATQFVASGTMGGLLYSAGGGNDPTIVASAVWTALTAGHTTNGTMGGLLLSASSGVSASIDVNEIANAVWQTNVSSYASGSAGFNQNLMTPVARDVSFIKDIEGGRWKIQSNQMIFYASDNVTEVARFDLFDHVGQPTMDSPSERRRS